MLNLLFLLLLPFLCVGPDTGHPAAASFPAARKTARSENRPIAIFFAPTACTECEVDWKKFLESPEARSYVPLKLNPEDFDAKAILDAWGPTTVPGWTILQADGTILDRWTGRWDRSAWPSRPVASNPIPKSKPEEKPVIRAKEEPATPTPLSAASTAPLATSPTAPGHGFRIQAGFFGSGANAENLVRQLEAKGFSGYEILSGKRDGKPYFRVVSGLYPSESAAREATPALTEAGFNAAVKSTDEL